MKSSRTVYVSPGLVARKVIAAASAFVLALGVAGSAGATGANAPVIQPSALKQIALLKSIKASKTPTQNKIDSRLFLGIVARQRPAEVALLKDFRFVKPEADGRIAVDIKVVTAAGVKPLLERLSQIAGAEVQAHSARYRSVSARVPMDAIEALAAAPEILKIRRAIPYMTMGRTKAQTEAKEARARRAEAARQAAGAALVRSGAPTPQAVNTSEGDVTHRAAPARAFFGMNGSGVKVCVISDGVDSLAALQATNDLPPVVDVLAGQAGAGDEGTAMLEIVHDLAPGAALGFATADPSPTQMATNIQNLRTVSGCDIIVDDIIYLIESPFQDNEIAEAVNTVTAAGALYFSSAGNQGNLNDGTSGTWEGDFNPNGTPAVLAGAGPCHNFGDAGQSVLVTASGQVTVLHWTDPFATAANDYDLYDLDGALTTIFDASTDVQDGAGGDDDPVEISGAAFSGERLVVAQFAGANRMFNLILFDGELAINTAGATRGHSATVNAFSVAATPAAAPFGGGPTGPFPGVFTTANQTEDFTSDGNRRIFFDNAGNLLPGAPAANFSSTGGVVRNKPDITAADGVSCAAPGFNPFFGTSAAAPHAAAIAALIKSKFPAITNAALRTAMINSALDIEIAGVDRDSGAGIVMAYDAIQILGGLPTANLTPGAPVYAQVTGNGNAFIEPGERWSITVPLTNVGGATATAITGTVTTPTAGVTMVNGTSPYADLVASASGNNTALYTFDVGAGFSCGGPIRFNFSAAYTGGPSPATSTFSTTTGVPGAPVTVSYVGPAVPIPDAADLSGTNPGASVVANLLVAGVGPIAGVQLRIDGSACSTTVGSTTVGIDHTFANDLQIRLRSPGGTLVTVVSNTDGSGNNFCQTLLQDGAATSIQSVVTANAPFTGTFAPANPLGTFIGENGNGTWQLEVQDFFSGDTGNIRAFSLILTPVACAQPTDVSLTKTTTSTNVFSGQPVAFVLTATNNGPGPAAGVVVTDTIPAGMNYVSNSCGATFASPTLTWNIGAMAFPGNAACTVNVTMAATPIGPVTNTATVNSTGSIDAVAQNNTGSATVQLGAAVATSIPTLGSFALMALAACLGAAALLALRRLG